MDSVRRFVFCSPHFDDAVGSCGGLIASLTRNQRTVCVLTLFAGSYQLPLSSFAEELHSLWGVRDAVRERSLENDRACMALGASAHNYDIPEALYRRAGKSWLYNTDRSLFAEPSPEDKGLPKRLCEKIEAGFSGDDVLFFPAGIGGHVDHVIASAAGVRLRKKGHQVYFYRDFSYSGKPSGEIPQEVFCFLVSAADYQRKLQAVAQYESQALMLFGESDSRAYYELFRLPIIGHYEQYFGTTCGWMADASVE
jgi:2'-N-acetylparomamine deacetylase